MTRRDVRTFSRGFFVVKVTKMLGSIHSVTLKNFMVYEHCVFRPTPGLNLVIGSNGKPVVTG